MERELTSKVIGAGIEVHKELGPGFLENVYEEALCAELETEGIRFERQKHYPIDYKGRIVGAHRLDLLVAGSVVVELKAVSRLEPVHFVIVRSYMRVSNTSTGIILNFGTMPLTVKRVGGCHMPKRVSETLHL